MERDYFKEFFMKKIIITGLCLLFVTIGAFAEVKELSPFTMPSPRSRALGGDHVGYAGGVEALVVNPAELNRKNEISIIGLSASLTNPLWVNKLGLAIKNGDLEDDEGDFDFLKIPSLIPSNPMRLPVGLGVQGPISAGFVKNGFGIGLFNRVYVDALVRGLNVEISANADVFLNAGYAYRFQFGDRLALDAGIGIKAFGRVSAEVDKKLTDLLKIISENGDGDFPLDEIGLSTLPLIVGGTADVGASLHLSFLPQTFNDDLTVGFVWKDAFSYAKDFTNLGTSFGLPEPSEEWKASEYIIPTSFQIGASYSFNLGKILKIAVMIDHNDAAGLIKYISLDEGNAERIAMRDPSLDTSLGAEVTLFNILSVRAGMKDLLPAVGLGLNLFVFQLDAALYGKELGTYPGAFTTMGLDVGFSFKF